MSRRFIWGSLVLGLLVFFSVEAQAQERGSRSEAWWERFSIQAEGVLILQGLYNSDDAVQKQQERGLNATREEGDILDATYSAELKLNAKVNENFSAHWVLEIGEGKGVDQVLTNFAFFNYDAYQTGEELTTDELYLEAHSRYVSFLFGKMDWVNQFDTNKGANDEVSQFLSRAFVVNPTIYGPTGYLSTSSANSQNTLSAILIFKPSDLIWVKYGVFENDADWNKIDGKDLVHFGELDVRWEINNNPGHIRAYYVENDGYKNEFPSNQLVNKAVASAGINGDQVIGPAMVFFRYGQVLDGKAGEFYSPYLRGMTLPDWHFSAGVNLTGLPLEGTLAIAYGFNHIPSEWRNQNEEEDFAKGETIAELYYRLRLNQVLSLTPDLIYIQYPGGVKAEAVFAYGLRTVLEF